MNVLRLTAEVTPKLSWYIARSSGIVSWILLTASVMWGLLLSARVLYKATAPGWLLDLHRYLGGLSIVLDDRREIVRAAEVFQELARTDTNFVRLLDEGDNKVDARGDDSKGQAHQGAAEKLSGSHANRSSSRPL